jgi:hypothetical protein
MRHAQILMSGARHTPGSWKSCFKRKYLVNIDFKENTYPCYIPTVSEVCRGSRVRGGAIVMGCHLPGYVRYASQVCGRRQHGHQTPNLERAPKRAQVKIRCQPTHTHNYHHTHTHTRPASPPLPRPPLFSLLVLSSGPLVGKILTFPFPLSGFRVGRSLLCAVDAVTEPCLPQYRPLAMK